MPPKSVVEIVKTFSLKMVSEFDFVEGVSVVKQLAVESAKKVGLDSSAVSLEKYDREFPGAKFEANGTRFWFITKSAKVKLIWENIPVGTEKKSEVHGWEAQMPEVKKNEGGSSSDTNKK